MTLTRFRGASLARCAAWFIGLAAASCAWAQPGAPAAWAGSYTCSTKPSLLFAAQEVFNVELRLTQRNRELTGMRESKEYMEKFYGSVDAGGAVTLEGDGFWAGGDQRYTRLRTVGSIAAGELLLRGERVENTGRSARTLDCTVALRAQRADLDGKWHGSYSCQPSGTAATMVSFSNPVEILLAQGRVTGSRESADEAETFFGQVGANGLVTIEAIGQLKDASRSWRLAAEGAIAGDQLRATGTRFGTGSWDQRHQQDCVLTLAREGLPSAPTAQAPVVPAPAAPATASEAVAPAARELAEDVAVAERPRPSIPAPRRLALVIGNDNYRHVSRLGNARADAQAMGASLSRLGFTVTSRTDLDERTFKQVLRQFRSEVQGGEEVVVFFAGHGVQLGGANYLLPIDIRGDSEEQVKDESLPLQRILDDFADRRAGFLLAIVDACRDNPFKGAAVRAIGGRGLAATTAASGQMVIFSAGSGQQALDRLGPTDSHPNGLFTRVFLGEMEKPDLTVDRVLRNVRNQVVNLARSVGHLQTPALYDQAVGDFYLKRAAR